MRLPAMLLLFALPACDCQPQPFGRCEGEPGGVAVTGPTWTRDVQPIIAGRCARCHDAGGLAPVALTTLDEVKGG